MTADARRAFLHELIDDAGLFPPASLPMAEATASHESSLAGPHGWMLGRFICPAARLTELARFVEQSESRWRLSVLDGSENELEDAAMFAGRVGDGASMELVEMRLGDRVPELASWRALGAEPFLEVPFEPEWREQVPALLKEVAGAEGAGAKIRCGGLTADAFPTPEQVGLFIATCRDLELRCKATAGLHRPFRHLDPASGFRRHGFLNLVGAAVLAHRHGLGPEELAEVVADEEPDDFALTPESFRWRHLVADADAITAARSRLFLAYGSCSFAEPLEYLRALGVLV